MRCHQAEALFLSFTAKSAAAGGCAALTDNNERSSVSLGQA